MNDTEAAALLSLVNRRIQELLTVRRLYRSNRWSAEWSTVRKAQEAELRTLLTLARAARKAARAAEQADAVTAAKGYHDWQAAGPVTEPELLAGYGFARPIGDEDLTQPHEHYYTVRP